MHLFIVSYVKLDYYLRNIANIGDYSILSQFEITIKSSSHLPALQFINQQKTTSQMLLLLFGHFQIFLGPQLLSRRAIAQFPPIFIFQRALKSYNQSVFMQSQAILITIISLSLISTSTAQTLSTSCFSGEYYSRTTHQCEQCDISCAQCTSADGCSLCYDQMYLSPVGNKVLCGYCYDILAGCTVCSSAFKCARCSNGYFLVSNGTCSNCSNLTPNCALCYQNATSSELYCSSCSDPFLLVDGVCVANATVTQIQASRDAIVFGASAGSNSQVSASASNRTVAPQNQQPPQIQQPQTQTPTLAIATASQSIACDTNFVQVGTICTIVIPFCTQYDTKTLKCDVCAQTYSKSSQGYCIPDILLLSSQTNSQTTNNIPSNQVGQNEQISTNTQIRLDSSQTASNIDARECPEGQYLWFGSCVTPGTQCTNRDSSNKCTNCIKGYTLRNGLCIQQIPANSTSPKDTIVSNNSVNNNNNGGLTSDENGSTAVNDNSFTVVTFLDQKIEVVSSGCTSPCVTCKRGEPNYCVTCIAGMTIVDLYPGICFSQN